ncbi:Hypothetical_protein [Hexamita inflata]|uniref:Hypothetical_protein n=1 Tax=Hexamita inflata TaxID=28002 RepID=A0AA86U534_9EUKA|nr:Hypothetical protein HINF_LOCUS27406 [Hexamita inflata]
MDLDTLLQDLTQSIETYEQRQVFQQMECLQQYISAFDKCDYKISIKKLQEFDQQTQEIPNQLHIQEQIQHLQTMDELICEKTKIQEQYKNDIYLSGLFQNLSQKPALEQLKFLIANQQSILELKEQQHQLQIFTVVLQSIQLLNQNQFNTLPINELFQFLSGFKQLVQFSRLFDYISQFVLDTTYQVDNELFQEIKVSAQQKLQQSIDKQNIEAIKLKFISKLDSNLQVQPENEQELQILQQIIDSRVDSFKVQIVRFLSNPSLKQLDNNTQVPEIADQFYQLAYWIMSCSLDLSSLLQISKSLLFCENKKMPTLFTLCILTLQSIVEPLAQTYSQYAKVLANFRLHIVSELKSLFRAQFQAKFDEIQQKSLHMKKYLEFVSMQSNSLNQFNISYKQSLQQDLEQTGIDIISVSFAHLAPDFKSQVKEITKSWAKTEEEFIETLKIYLQNKNGVLVYRTLVKENGLENKLLLMAKQVLKFVVEGQ